MARGRWPDFYSSVRDSLTGSPGPVALEDAIANLVVLDAARSSATTRQRVHLSPAVHHA